MNIIDFITANPEFTAAVTTAVVIVIDYIVKKTTNKIDDAIWSVIKKPLVDFFKNKSNKK